MARSCVRILHVEPERPARSLERFLADARRRNGERQATAFRAAGADDVELLDGPPDDTPFGRRLAGLIAAVTEPTAGIVVLGSGAIPLATPADRRAFLSAARDESRQALANNRYSADIVAIGAVAELPPLPDLPADNALPRWLEEVAGWTMADLRDRWRLQVDLDGPLDVELVRPGSLPAAEGAVVRRRLAGIRAVLADPRAELLVAGRTSADTLRWLEGHARCRVRALVEERGLRASSRLALQDGSTASRPRAPGRARPPRSVLGTLLDRDGPESLGDRLAELGDAALVDSRVLMAHRLGADERTWPSPEDRFASDLLDDRSVRDPWLRAITTSAAAAPIPVLLGGHSLVGPGVRLVARAAAPDGR